MRVCSLLSMEGRRRGGRGGRGRRRRLLHAFGLRRVIFLVDGWVAGQRHRCNVEEATSGLHALHWRATVGISDRRGCDGGELLVALGDARRLREWWL